MSYSTGYSLKGGAPGHVQPLSAEEQGPRALPGLGMREPGLGWEQMRPPLSGRVQRHGRDRREEPCMLGRVLRTSLLTGGSVGRSATERSEAVSPIAAGGK